MNEFIMLGIGLVLTVGTGLFVASEFALVNLDRHELEGRAAAGEKRLGPTIKALRITSTHLSSAQLGITLTTLLTGYTFEPGARFSRSRCRTPGSRAVRRPSSGTRQQQTSLRARVVPQRR